ncbi:MAG: hypothetical protein KBB86_00900 [Candidatus Pacebacteria bacterium]|nr:hypothetical protein [Candidatus Paceibacterota bacterium]
MKWKHIKASLLVAFTLVILGFTAQSSYGQNNTLLVKKTTFEEMIQIFKLDSNVNILDTCHKYPGDNYIIAYTDRHFVENYLSLPDTHYLVRNVALVQQEIFKSTRKLKDYNFYIEGLPDTYTPDSLGRPQIVADSLEIARRGQFFDWIAGSDTFINIRGVESDSIRTLANVVRLLQEWLESLSGASESQTDDIQLKLFRYNLLNFEESFIDKVTWDAGEDDLRKTMFFTKEISRICDSLMDKPYGPILAFNEVVEMSSRYQEHIKICERNKHVVDLISVDPKGVLILGANHFKNMSIFSTKYPKCFIEDLLEAKKINYIILQPKSINLYKTN